MDEYTRRTLLGALGAATAGGLAGCGLLGPGDIPPGDVVVGSNYFDPDEFTVSVGDTVTWTVRAPGHNVCGDPADHEDVSIPDDADPFASYGVGGTTSEYIDQATTYEHTFETPGEYHYVCIPHAGVGMEGTILVEEGTDGTATE